MSIARARGWTLSWARRRTDWRSSSSSSGRSKCTGEGYLAVRPGTFWSLTPDEPETPSLPDPGPEDPAKSRADLQAELRKTRKKEKKRRHRWRRRSLYAVTAVVLLAALGAGGLYVYANYRFDQIKKIHANTWCAAHR